MGARELLSDLTAAGFALAADGDKVVIRPASKLTDAVRAAVRAAKPDLLMLLTQPPDADAAPTPDEHLTADGLEDLDDAAKARFYDRRDRLIAWGHDVDDAQSMALRLAKRDAESDDRRLCIECRHLERAPVAPGVDRQAGDPRRARDAGRGAATVARPEPLEVEADGTGNDRRCRPAVTDHLGASTFRRAIRVANLWAETSSGTRRSLLVPLWDPRRPAHRPRRDHAPRHRTVCGDRQSLRTPTSVALHVDRVGAIAEFCQALKAGKAHVPFGAGTPSTAYPHVNAC